MEEILKNKNIQASLTGLLIVASLFLFVKFINEIKQSEYIGKDYQYSNTISVNGTGEVTAVADIANLSFDIEKEGTTAKEAQSLLNESLSKTLSYLKEQGIEDKDIKSSYGGLNPKYESTRCYYYPCPVNNSKIIGYTAIQSIEIKVRNVDIVNDIRTGLSSFEITNISGPTFSIDEEDTYKEEARAEAIKNAQEKAKILAKDLGIKLGKITSFYEEGEGDQIVYTKSLSFDETTSTSSVSTLILPKGENKITSNVVITFTIK